MLALRGANIIACARTIQKAQDTMDELGIDGTPIACDLADFPSVGAAVEVIKGLHVPIQCIIANAGIMALPTLHQKHGYEIQFFTNHVGHFHFVTGLVDSLTDNGRVVVLSSRATHMLDNMEWRWTIYLERKTTTTGGCMDGVNSPIFCLHEVSTSALKAQTSEPILFIQASLRPIWGVMSLDREAMYEQIQRTIPLKDCPSRNSHTTFGRHTPRFRGRWWSIFQRLVKSHKVFLKVKMMHWLKIYGTQQKQSFKTSLVLNQSKDTNTRNSSESHLTNR